MPIVRTDNGPQFVSNVFEALRFLTGLDMYLAIVRYLLMLA